MSRKINFFGFFLFLVFLFLFLPGKVLAQVIINEVMWMGSSKSSDDEWIELKNISDQNIQLNGWKIDNLLEKNGTFTFPSEPVIEISSRGFLLVSYYSKADRVAEDKTILDNPGLVWRCKGNSSCSTFSLANSGNGDLVLRNSEGIEIDRALGGSWPAGKKENGICYSMERVNPLVLGSDPNNWKTATEAKNLISGVSDKATPESENSILSSTPTPNPTPTSTPTSTSTFTPTPTPASYSNIYISEFMANPDSGNEWVELFNNNDFEVDLSGWYIDDVTSGGKEPKPISGTISGKGYKQFFISDFYFNNDGDEVRLLDGNQTEKDKKTFTTSTKGKSWSKDNNGNWCQTDPTPNSSNPVCSSSTPSSVPTPTLTITPSKTPTPTKNLTPSLSLTPTSDETGELNLVGQTSGNSSVLGLQTSPTPNPKNKDLTKVIPVIFIILGLALLGVSVFFLLKEKISFQKQEGI